MDMFINETKITHQILTEPHKTSRMVDCSLIYNGLHDLLMQCRYKNDLSIPKHLSE